MIVDTIEKRILESLLRTCGYTKQGVVVPTFLGAITTDHLLFKLLKEGGIVGRITLSAHGNKLGRSRFKFTVKVNNSTFNFSVECNQSSTITFGYDELYLDSFINSKNLKYTNTLISLKPVGLFLKSKSDTLDLVQPNVLQLEQYRPSAISEPIRETPLYLFT